MAEYVTVVRELQRMCDKNRCAECPITKTRHECINCQAWMYNHPEEVERIVMQWATEHPKKTNRQKFVEVFGCEIVTHEIHDAIPGHVKILNASDEEFEEWLNAEY